MLPSIVLSIVLSITTKHNFIPILVWTPDWKMLQNFECCTGHSLTESPPGPLEQGVLHGDCTPGNFQGETDESPQTFAKGAEKALILIVRNFLFCACQKTSYTPTQHCLGLWTFCFF